MRFFLGTHETSWLERVGTPLFVSHRRLLKRKRLPRARGLWALDSGGFSELAMYGRWVTEPVAYMEAARRYRDEIGKLAWAAPMDWMCEPSMLAKTGLTVDRHQGLTVENVSLLREQAPDVPWIPVLQGWTLKDYLACYERYQEAGISLENEPTVGVGSVCKRQGTEEIAGIFRELSQAHLSLHGFGVKTQGLGLYADSLQSADSMAWSYDGRRSPPLPGHTHLNCANCLDYALQWRRRLMDAL